MEVLECFNILVHELLMRKVDLFGVRVDDDTFDGDCFEAVVSVGGLHHKGELVQLTLHASISYLQLLVLFLKSIVLHLYFIRSLPILLHLFLEFLILSFEELDPLLLHFVFFLVVGDFVL